MAGTAWHNFSPLTKIYSSQVNENFDWMEGHIVPQSAGSQTDSIYDLGTTTNRWRNGYFSTLVTVGTNGALSIGSTNSSIDVSLQTVMRSDASTTQFGVARLVAHSNTDMANGFGGSLHFSIRDSANVINNIAFINWQRQNSADNTGGFIFYVSNSASSKIAMTLNYDQSIQLSSGGSINEFSTDTTLAGNSDLAVPTEKAVKTYIDAINRAGARIGLDSATTAAITLSTTARKIPFNIESYDIGSNYDNSTNYRFTAPETGRYQVLGNLMLASLATTSVIKIQIYKNGSISSDIWRLKTTNDSSSFAVGFADSFSMSSSDYLEIYALHTESNTLTVVQNDVKQCFVVYQRVS